MIASKRDVNTKNGCCREAMPIRIYYNRIAVRFWSQCFFPVGIGRINCNFVFLKDAVHYRFYFNLRLCAMNWTFYSAEMLWRYRQR